MRRLIRRFESLERRALLSCSKLCIAEFLASNDEEATDFYGESSDWIEIHNPTGATVDLQGWHLTDDATDLSKWTFDRSASIEAGQRLLVWASDRDSVDPDGEFHTNFKLSSGGEYLALVQPDGLVAFEYGSSVDDYPAQSTDVSYGIDADGEERYLLTPTPGTPNGVGTLGFVADTKFSADRGFYESPFALTISSATPNATLVYTLDGSVPSASNGVQIVGNSQSTQLEITVDKTTTVRAMAFRDGWEPTNVDTQTYIFADQVIRQTGDGLPDTWGHAGADYEMDPEVVNDSQYRDIIVDGLKSIPTLSLVSDLDNWFDPRNGIYPEGSGEPIPISAELVHADGTEGFQVDASVEIQGGSSTNRWKSDKLSMQLKFKREFGDAKLEYPLFGDDATDEFDTLVIDARLNQAWHYGGGSSPTSQRERAQYARDQFVADLQNELGGLAPHGRWVHVYLNGIYWGIHNLHERPDEHFASAYYGGSDDDYDIIKHNNDVVNGSFANYRRLLDAVNGDTRDDEQYAQIEELLDIEQFVDYMQVNFYVGNTDWAHHNWYASYNKAAADGKWRFHSWDAEHVLKGINDNATGRDDAQGPTHIHARLMRNEQYRVAFMDAVQRNFFNGGVFTVDRAKAMYRTRLDEVFEALVPESARWGDNHRRDPYTRDDEWMAERDRLMDSYFPRRTDIVVDQLRDRDFFHEFDAPRFNIHGGEVESGFEARLRGVGHMIYTTDGSDPRTSESAIEFDESIPITADTHVRVRSNVDGEWSALVEARFLVQVAQVPGDFSGNGVVDAADIDLLSLAVRNSSTDNQYDLDEDGFVGPRDTENWIQEIAETRRGDANLDGNVDFQDFLIMSSRFGQDDQGWADGDFNGDGSVSFEDFLFLSANFGFKR